MPDFIVASTTASQEEMDHAVSADWRAPIAVKEPEPKEVKPEPVTEAPAGEADPDAPATSEEEVKTVPDSEPDEAQERPKGKGGFQKKIDKLTREKGELAAQLSKYEERFAEIEKRLAPPAETKPEERAASIPHQIP